MRRGGLLIALVMVTGLCSVAPAQGAVTIGSNLTSGGAFANGGFCNPPCTVTNLALPPAFQAPGGLSSPIDGVATSWRARGNMGTNLRLRILRPVVATTFTGAGTSDPASFAGPGISPSFPSSLAVKAGDFVGLESANSELILSPTVGATAAYWNMPVLPDGTTRSADGTGMTFEANVQAVIEPDVDCDKLGDETQDGTIRQGCMVKVLSGAAAKGTLNLQVQCPLVTQNCDNNTVTLATATAVKLGKSKAAGSAKKKKKKAKAKIIPIGTVTTSVLAGQTKTVPLTLTGNANALFRQRTSVAVSATVTGSGKTLIEPFTATSSNPKPKKKKKKKKN